MLINGCYGFCCSHVLCDPRYVNNPLEHWAHWQMLHFISQRGGANPQHAVCWAQGAITVRGISVLGSLDPFQTRISGSLALHLTSVCCWNRWVVIPWPAADRVPGCGCRSPWQCWLGAQNSCAPQGLGLLWPFLSTCQTLQRFLVGVCP